MADKRQGNAVFFDRYCLAREVGYNEVIFIVGTL
jgi:hypothetical protein